MAYANGKSDTKDDCLSPVVANKTPLYRVNVKVVDKNATYGGPPNDSRSDPYILLAVAKETIASYPEGITRVFTDGSVQGDGDNRHAGYVAYIEFPEESKRKRDVAFGSYTNLCVFESEIRAIQGF
ncbi:hypothetical protein Btru_066034 [Bulinus truncatus]|nr:hypothetical protein Btru_066034 [Bulinus truncatus]